MSPLPRGDHMDAGRSTSPYSSAQQRPLYDDRYDRDAYHDAYHEDDGVLRPSSPQFESAPVDSDRARMETAELIEQQFLDGRAITATPSGEAMRNASPREQSSGMSRYKKLWHFAYGEVCKQLGIKVSSFF